MKLIPYLEAALGAFGFEADAPFACTFRMPGVSAGRALWYQPALNTLDMCNVRVFGPDVGFTKQYTLSRWRDYKALVDAEKTTPLLPAFLAANLPVSILEEHAAQVFQNTSMISSMIEHALLGPLTYTYIAEMPDTLLFLATHDLSTIHIRR